MEKVLEKERYVHNGSEVLVFEMELAPPERKAQDSRRMTVRLQELDSLSFHIFLFPN